MPATPNLDNKNNAQFLSDWDAGKNVSVHALPKGGDLIAVETLRALIAAGYSPATWNAVSDAEWQTVKADVIASHKALADTMTADALESATNIGQNYFEHGHDFILGGTPVEDRVVMKRA